MSRAHARIAIAALLLANLVTAIAADRDYYAYQRSDQPIEGMIDASFTAANATREAGSLARRGFENEARLGWSPDGSWLLEGGGGTLSGTSDSALSWHVESRYSVASDDAHDSHYQLGAGYLRDFDGVSVPYLRFGASRGLASWNVAAGALIQKPLSPQRDPLDVILSVGASRAVAQNARLGFEAAGEDLEGLFAAQEAEGGAKLVLGPTLILPMSSGVARVNVGWIHTLSATPTSLQDAASKSVVQQNGLVARLTLSL